MTTEANRPSVPGWMHAVRALILAVLLAALVYAAAIAVANWSRIGV